MRNVSIGAGCLALIAVVALAAARSPRSQRQDIVAADPLGLASGAAAAEAVTLSLQQLTETASLIVTGRTIAVESRWIDPRNLATFATVAVDDVLKGSASGSITVVTPGGIDANRRIPIAMTFPGAPKIDEDERVLLFLTDDADNPGTHSVVGYAQGKYSIVSDPQGRELVSRSNVTIRLESGTGPSYSTVQAVSLAEVTAAIQSLVQ
jgi:hypothetical protein